MIRAERRWPGNGPLHVCQGTGPDTLRTWSLLRPAWERYPLACLPLAPRPKGREEREKVRAGQRKAAAQEPPAQALRKGSRQREQTDVQCTPR